MKKREYDHLKYVISSKSGYYEITDVDGFLNLETDIIKTIFKIQCQENMYYAYISRLIEEKLMSETDIETAKKDLILIPHYDMLYTQEFLEEILVDRMLEEFDAFKVNIEEEFILMIQESLNLE